MLFLSVLLSIAIGALRGGSLRDLGQIRFEKPWLLFLAFLFRTSIELVGRWGVEGFSDYSPWLIGLSYLLIIKAASLNRALPGMSVLGLGVLANFIVISLNGGKMPVSTTALLKTVDPVTRAMLEAGRDPVHQLLRSDTVLPFLTDIFYLPPPVPLVFSIGDILICTGVFLLIQSGMRTQQGQGTVLP